MEEAGNTMQPIIKTVDEIKKLEVANRIVAETLALVEKSVKPGITTLELDRIADDYIRTKNAHPSFKGYKVDNLVFPNALCISVNNEIIHGIPRSSRVLHEGDIVSVDCGAYIGGYHGDSALTIPVGEISERDKHLLKITEEALFLGIEKAVHKKKLYDISRAIQQHCEKEGFELNRDFSGHGIGKDLHEAPSLPNYVPPLLRRDYFPNVMLKKGMAIAIEPMVHVGSRKCKVLNDGWTVVTADGENAAHFEHTVVVDNEKPIILTLRD